VNQIGFRPPEPPRKWCFDIDGRIGYIEETITPDMFYLYDWRSENGTSGFGILQSDHAYTIEDVEAKLRTRLNEPGLVAHA